MRKNRTNIDEVLASLVGCWLLLERRNRRKNLSREPTRLRSQLDACPIFECSSRRNFGACVRKNRTNIDEVLVYLVGCCLVLFVVFVVEFVVIVVGC